MFTTSHYTEKLSFFYKFNKVLQFASSSNFNLIDKNLLFVAVIQNKVMPVPALQKPAPAFQGTAVVKGEFKEISLSDYKGKYVVLFFYPLDL